MASEKTVDTLINLIPAPNNVLPVPEEAPSGITQALVDRGLFEKLYDLISTIPNNIPEASDYDVLAVFTGNPQDANDLSLSTDKLWEELLNGIMKLALGWGNK